METFNSRTAARIVGVSLRQIQYWDERGFIRPSVRAAAGRGTKRLYSFSDLVKLKVVKNLSDHGLGLQKIRRCVNYLKGYVPDRPARVRPVRYLTDGDKLFVLTSDRKRILDVMERHFVFSLGIGHLVRELDGEVRRNTAQNSERALKGQRKDGKKKAGSA